MGTKRDGGIKHFRLGVPVPVFELEPHFPAELDFVRTRVFARLASLTDVETHPGILGVWRLDVSHPKRPFRERQTQIRLCCFRSN